MRLALPHDSYCIPLLDHQMPLHGVSSPFFRSFDDGFQRVVYEHDIINRKIFIESSCDSKIIFKSFCCTPQKRCLCKVLMKDSPF